MNRVLEDCANDVLHSIVILLEHPVRREGSPLFGSYLNFSTRNFYEKTNVLNTYHGVFVAVVF